MSGLQISVFIGILAIKGTLWAQNHHDHLYMIPRASDFVAAGLGDSTKGLSFEGQNGSAEQNQLEYDRIIDLRKNLYLMGTADEVEALFIRYAANEQPENLVRIKATVSRRAFAPEQLEKLIRVRSVIEAKGGSILYYMSLQRKLVLTESDFLPPHFRELVGMNLLNGFDISGSLHESEVEPWESGLSPFDIRDRLVRFFHLAASLRTALRIHAFENRDHGPFYDGLQLALSHWRGPLQLEMGHMATMSMAWLQWLAQKTDNLQLTLQATPPSYHLLVRNFSAQSLADRIATGRSLGLAVEFGFDGRGAFEHTWPQTSPWPTTDCETLVLGLAAPSL